MKSLELCYVEFGVRILEFNVKGDERKRKEGEGGKA